MSKAKQVGHPNSPASVPSGAASPTNAEAEGIESAESLVAAADPAPELDAAEQRAWRSFLVAHARVARRLEADLLARSHLPLAEFDVLMQLSLAEGQRLRMNELADRVVLSRAGITRLGLAQPDRPTRSSSAADLRRARAASARRIPPGVGGFWPADPPPTVAQPARGRPGTTARPVAPRRQAPEPDPQPLPTIPLIRCPRPQRLSETQRQMERTPANWDGPLVWPCSCG